MFYHILGTHSRIVLYTKNTFFLKMQLTKKKSWGSVIVLIISIIATMQWWCEFKKENEDKRKHMISGRLMLIVSQVTEKM